LPTLEVETSSQTVNYRKVCDVFVTRNIDKRYGCYTNGDIPYKNTIEFFMRTDSLTSGMMSLNTCRRRLSDFYNLILKKKPVPDERNKGNNSIHFI